MQGLDKVNILTDRLIITTFTLDMALDVSKNSLDEDNKRFVPDEVFETEEEAKEVIKYLIEKYKSNDGPFVYPILLHDLTNIGYVQLVLLDDDTWEVGYHIGIAYTKKGYATEAVKAFLPYIAKKLGISSILGVCLEENIASKQVLKKSGFETIFEGIGDYQGEKRKIYKGIWKL